MKTVNTKTILFILLISSTIAFAQEQLPPNALPPTPMQQNSNSSTPPPPPSSSNAAPIPGIAIAAMAAAGYGLKKANDRRKN